MEMNTDAVEVLVHVDQPHLAAGAEFFTCPSYGWTLRDVMEETASMDLKVILNIDWHHGNGRSDSQSPVSPGRYHNSITEGGVDEGIRAIASWGQNYDHIIGIQLGNEQSTPDAWYEDRCRFARTVIPSDWKIVVGGDRSNMEVGARYADVIDPHLLRSDWRLRMARAETIANDHELEIWVTELSPPLDVSDAQTRANEYRLMCRYLKDNGYSPGVFVGNVLDYPLRNGIRWNFKTLHDFTAWKNHGRTVVGDIYEMFFGAAAPIEPPPEDDVLTKQEVKDLLEEVNEILDSCNTHDDHHGPGEERKQFRREIRGPLREVRSTLREAVNK
jgi:hypothetical protein